METSLTHDHLTKLFADADLDAGYLPKQIRPVDAFRQATTSVKRRFSYDSVECRLFIEETRTTIDQVQRRIMLERRVRNRKPTLEPAGECIFFRQGRSAQSRIAGSAKLRFTINQKLARPESEQVRNLTESIQAEYQQLSQHLTQVALRMVIRRYLEEVLHGVAIKPSGGIYHVQPRYQEGLESLTAIVNAFPGESMMHWVTMADTEANSELVQHSMIVELVKDLEVLLGKLVNIRLGDRGYPTRAVMVTLDAECKLILDRVEALSILGPVPDDIDALVDSVLAKYKMLALTRPS